MTANLLEEQGGTSKVYRVETIQGVFLVKSSFKKKYRMWLAEEARILKALKPENQIPVPEYQGFIEDEDSSTLLMSFKKGVTLTAALREAASVDEKKALLNSFGQFLHQFHALEPLGMFAQEKDWLEGQLVEAQGYVDNGETEGSQKLLDQLTAKKLAKVKQTMIHGDCTTDNIFVISGNAALFIDAGGMAIGDPRYDISLAIRKFVDDPELLEAFYGGYTRYRVSSEEFQYFDEGLYEFF